MYNKLELLIDDFYKNYYKVEAINLSLVIKCLTTTELHIIECIGMDKLTIKDLSEKLGITMGTMSVALNKLEEKNFINRIRSNKDKRKVYVSLNKKGKIAYAYHGNYHETILEKLTETIDKEKLQIFTEIFEELLNNLKSMKLNLEPENLNNFSIGDYVEITEIRGNSVIRVSMSENNIQLKKIIKILDIHQDLIRIMLDKKEKLISKEQAKYIYGIKREI